MPTRRTRAVRRGTLVLGREQAVESAAAALGGLILPRHDDDSAQVFALDLLTPHLLLRSIRTHAHSIRLQSRHSGHVELSADSDSGGKPPALAPGLHCELEYYDDLYTDADEHPPTLPRNIDDGAIA